MSSFVYGTEYKIQGKWVATDSFEADYSGESKSIEANDPAAPKLTFATAGEQYYPQVMYSWHENQVRWEINGEVFTLHVLSGPGMLERPYQKYVSIQNPQTRSYKRYKLVEITEEEEEENNEWYQSVTDQIWCNDSQWESFPTKDRIDNVDATTLPADENGFVIKGSALYRYDEGIGGPVVNIPDGIKRIKSRAFSECHGITHVHVPNSVGSLGDACFSGCENLVSIRLPEGLKCIGNDMFSGCAKLQEINLPSTLTSIGCDSFALCGALEEVIFPETLTTISSRAFSAAKSLRKIKLNSGLKKIEFAAFNDCTALTELHIPASVKDIGVLAFDGCTGIKEIVVEDGNEVYYSKNNCLFADKILVLACDNSLVPDDGSVEIIGSHAFSNCKAIESIVLPEAMTAIERNAFSGCTSLKSIQLPRSMSNGYGDFRRKVCGDGLFRGCSSLEYFEIPDWMTEIPEDMFEGCESLKEIKIPDFVTKIGSRAFDGCTSLTELVIPKGVTQIAGEWARSRHNGEFIAGCSSLKRLVVEEGNPTYHSVDNCIIETATGMLFAILENGVIPTDGSITAIGENAFCACTNLTEIALPEGITTIGDNAFSRISNLKKINIPQSVNEIGSNVFFGIMKENRHDAVEEENGV